MIKIERNDRGEIVGIVMQDEIILNVAMMNCCIGRMLVTGCIVEDASATYNVTTKPPRFEANEVVTQAPDPASTVVTTVTP